MLEYKNDVPFFDREMSWLSFNGRVLQEAKDKHNPLFERLTFLAIYSNNLDEFYSVRVASHRNLIRVEDTAQEELDVSPKQLLKRINTKVEQQQEEFGRIFREEIMPELEDHHIHLHNDQDLNQAQQNVLETFYHQQLEQHLDFQWIEEQQEAPFLEDKQLYFFIRVKKDNEVRDVIVKIPTDALDRFIVLEEETEGYHIIMLDDAIRANFHLMFPDSHVMHCYAIKLSRDAELYLEDELGDQVVDKIKNSLKKRELGVPSRFLYDSFMPDEIMDELTNVFNLEAEDLIPGAQYHNFSDFMDFPFPEEPSLRFYPQPSLSYPPFDRADTLQEAVDNADHCLHFPYQDYGYVVRLIDEAVQDPTVTSIKMTIYRVADGSAICKALVKAAQAGKEVMVFDEVQARFDEASNLYWGEQLEKAGAKVIYSHEGLKVHSKICLITRQTGDTVHRQALLSTGNFNEKTAKVYCDLALFTARPSLTQEVDKAFALLQNPHHPRTFDELLVAPYELRDKFTALIDREIKNAKEGKEARIFAKMNSLHDKKIIQKLYEASQAGVEINMLVRAICCLVPGVKGVSENITIRSIVGRYLEHARVYIFHNDGQEEMYSASADWMKRNLNRRIEVGFPVYDQEIYRDIRKMMELQWADNAKARVIDQRQTNPYRKATGVERINSQEAFYQYLQERADQQEPVTD